MSELLESSWFPKKGTRAWLKQRHLFQRTQGLPKSQSHKPRPRPPPLEEAGVGVSDLPRGQRAVSLGSLSKASVPWAGYNGGF